MASSYIDVLARNLRFALRKSDLEEAEALLERLKEEAPLELKTRGLELELLIKQHRYDEGERLSSELLRLFPASSRIQFLAGELAYRQKRYKPAVTHFRESFRLYAHWRSECWLGKALTQVGALDEAQDILERHRPHNPWLDSDLAWLYERKNDFERAITCHERILEREPNNRFSHAQVERLKGKQLDPEELVDELESLEDLGEEIPEHLLADFVANLFKTGQGLRARELLAEKRAGFDSRLCLKVGWSCYNAQAYDLAFELWTGCLGENLKAYKFLNTFESAARKSDNVARLKALYEEMAPRDGGLYGRLRKYGWLD